MTPFEITEQRLIGAAAAYVSMVVLVAAVYLPAGVAAVRRRWRAHRVLAVTAAHLDHALDRDPELAAGLLRLKAAIREQQQKEDRK